MSDNDECILHIAQLQTKVAKSCIFIHFYQKYFEGNEI